MQANDPRYDRYAICTDMLAAPSVVAGFDPGVGTRAATAAQAAGKLLLTGEGSSRLFPAKHAIKLARQRGYNLQLYTEAGCQSRSYQLDDWAVLAASNSGRTAEVIQLFQQLRHAGHEKRFCVAAFADSTLASFSNHGVVLSCGAEGAVAATKSVIEQALVVQAVVEEANDNARLDADKQQLADAVRIALTLDIPAEVTDAVAKAPVVYWAGPNDGVAEELTLKTNEITRQRAGYLEGTYAAHGIEEVMDADDVVVWIDPIEDQEEKFQQVLTDGVGVKVIAISSRQTRFPTVRVPDAGDLSGYVYLAAGWNVLIEVGIARGVDPDKPVRARKVGNAYAG